MKQERLDFFKKLNDDEKMKLESKDFTISEIAEIIAETPMKDIDKRISVARYIKCMTIDEIAEQEQIDKKTAKARLQKISLQLKLTCTKLLV